MEKNSHFMVEGKREGEKEREGGREKETLMGFFSFLFYSVWIPSLKEGATFFRWIFPLSQSQIYPQRHSQRLALQISCILLYPIKLTIKRRKH